MFQSYHLLDNLTVYENIDLPLSYRDVKRGRTAGHGRPTSSTASTSSARRTSIPNQLSGGQQQLVAIARAVVANPSIILADEPTGNLHSDQGREIMELFARLNAQGTTIVQVTHSEVNAAFGEAGDSTQGRMDRRWRLSSPSRDPASPTTRPTCSRRCGCCSSPKATSSTRRRSPAQVVRALELKDYDVVLIDLNYARDTTSGDEGLDLLQPHPRWPTSRCRWW